MYKPTIMHLTRNIVLLFLLLAVSSCLWSRDNYNDSILIKRLESKLPQYTKIYIPTDSQYSAPAYNSAGIIYIYEDPPRKPELNPNDIYPTYDPDEDNPVYPNTSQQPQVQPAPQYQYPIYDPDDDNPYYSGQAYNNFNDRVYKGFYPEYDSGEDNPSYPTAPAQTPQQPAQKYQYPTYNPDDDNPVSPPTPDKSQFNTPMFDRPMFQN